jgi:hypothetical protein
MLDLAPETQRLIEARSAATGKTPDEVVTEALQATEAKTAPRRIDRAALDALLKKWDAMPTYDTRSEKEILDEAWGD